MRFADLVRAAALTLFIIGAALVFLLVKSQPGSFFSAHFYEILGVILIICIAAAVFDLTHAKKRRAPPPVQEVEKQNRILMAQRKLRMIAALVIVIAILIFAVRIGLLVELT